MTNDEFIELSAFLWDASITGEKRQALKSLIRKNMGYSSDIRKARKQGVEAVQKLLKEMWEFQYNELNYYSYNLNETQIATRKNTLSMIENYNNVVLNEIVREYNTGFSPSNTRSNTRSNKIRCDNCSGTGYFNCSECSGTGMSLSYSHRGYEPCSACNTTGRKYCSICNGTGYQ